MKKIITIISVLAALVACSKVAPMPEVSSENSTQELNFNINISCPDVDETKGTAKTGFEDGDVVFAFFKYNSTSSIEGAKYLELRREDGKWVATPKNGLCASDFTVTGGGRCLAVYLPYGSDYLVEQTSSYIYIQDGGNNYYGNFYYSDRDVDKYTFNPSTSTLSVSFTLNAAAYTTSKSVHFDISAGVSGGFDKTHTYTLYQDYMKPEYLNYIGSSAVMSLGTSAANGGIVGYYDDTRKIMSFSGLLLSTAVGETKTYDFYLRDNTDGTLYYRTAGSQTISDHAKIGLGNLSKWTVVNPESAFSVSGSKQVSIARSNLSYRGSETNKWQLMKYPWTKIEVDNAKFNPTETSEIGLFGWATSGYNGIYPYTNSADNASYGPALADGKEWTEDSANWDWGINNTIYAYGGVTAFTNDYYRTPTISEWKYLFGLDATGIADDDTHPRYRKYGRAAIYDGTNTIHGVVIVPDIWTDPQSTCYLGTSGSYFNNGNNATYGGTESTYGTTGSESNTSTNYYTLGDWNKMERSGAVFFPASGNVKNPGTSAVVQNTTEYARLWSSTAGASAGTDALVQIRAYCIDFRPYGTETNQGLGVSDSDRGKARSVRLVHDLN